MAEVYRGTQRGAEGFSKVVAVKRVLPGYSNDPSFAEMFVAEATIASRLTHPNVISVTDFDRDVDGRLFLVMELVDGRDLRALVKSGQLPLSIVAHVTAELLRALAYAHELHFEGRPMKIVHRDVSPHNILISWDGAVKLSDFGIAKAAEASPATRTGVVKGKAAYLSPEQARAESIDHRSDLFAAGVVLHELLTHQRLFAVEGGAPEAVVIHRVLQLPVPSPRERHPEISVALDTFCRRLLERDVDRRPRSAKVALEELLACPETSPRGQLELAHLMRARFPDAPSSSFPTFHVPSSAPVGDFTASTLDARALPADGDGSPEAAARSAPTRARDGDAALGSDEYARAPAPDASGLEEAPGAPATSNAVATAALPSDGSTYALPPTDDPLGRDPSTRADPTRVLTPSPFAAPPAARRARWPLSLLVAAIVGVTLGGAWLAARPIADATPIVVRPEAPGAEATPRPSRAPDAPVAVDGADSKGADSERRARPASDAPSTGDEANRAGASTEAAEDAPKPRIERRRARAPDAAGASTGAAEDAPKARIERRRAKAPDAPRSRAARRRTKAPDAPKDSTTPSATQAPPPPPASPHDNVGDGLLSPDL